MSVREAKLSDREALRALFAASLTEEHAAGLEVKPSRRSVNYYLSYFDSYTRGSRFGVCLLWQPKNSPKGFILLGEQWEPDGRETDTGRMAWLWDLYVDPSYRKLRAGMELAIAAHQWAIDTKFDAIGFNIPGGWPSEHIAEAFGAVPRGVWYTVDLRPKAKRGS